MIWIQVHDVRAGHARLAAAGVPIVREPVGEPRGLVEMWIQDPYGIRIVLVEVPADHPLRRDPRPALPSGRRTSCRITARSSETRHPSARLVWPQMRSSPAGQAQRRRAGRRQNRPSREHTRTGESSVRIRGSCGRGRASDNHSAAPGCVRRLHRGLPAYRDGVRIRHPSVRGSPGAGGYREVRLRERVRLRAVPGLRPGRQPAPAAAAAHFARHGDVAGVPDRGWRQAGRHGRGATVRSGPVTLHVVQGLDQTWQVDSGNWCS
jgi:Glyoxalase/Bleomycin resistance protein/Dioxygenase superfamily